MSGRSELIPVTLAAAFTCGVVLSLANHLRLPLARRLGGGETAAGRLGLLANLVLVPAAFFGGYAVDVWGVEWVLIGGALLAALAVAGLALGQRFAAAAVALSLVGAAGATLGAAANVLMPPAFFPDRPVVAANLGNVFVVLGMLAAPVLGDVLLERVGFRRTAGLFALVCLAPALAAALTVAPAFPAAAAARPELPLEDHLLWAAALAFLLYGPLENMLTVWAPSYLTGLGNSERRAAWLMTGFWVAYLAGRFLTALGLQHGPPRPGVEAGSLVVLVLVAAVALGNLAGTTTRGAAAGYLLLAGLCLGPTFPTLVGLVFERYPGERGTLFGLMFAAGGLGSAVFVPLLGAYARRVTVQRAMRLPTVVALALAAAALVLTLLLPPRR